MPTIITRCSNNFGPFQNKEKFIPKLINSINNKSKFTLYGNGKNVREWIYVLDHCEALEKIIRKGKAGNIYNIGSETIQSFNVGVSIGDLWFVKRRKI